MGMSATARLRYGVVLGGESGWENITEYEYGLPSDLKWLEDGEVREVAEMRLLATVGFTEEWTDGREGYYGRRSTAAKLIPVEIESFGTYDYADYALVVKEPDFHVYFGVKNIDIPAVSSGWADDLSAALSVLGITPTKPPGWLLGAHYG